MRAKLGHSERARRQRYRIELVFNFQKILKSNAAALSPCRRPPLDARKTTS